MNRAEIYRRAAELVSSAVNMYITPDKWFSCNAILLASEWKGSDARVDYADRFASGEWLSTIRAEDEWGQNGRVLALCFAAAMADAGDL